MEHISHITLIPIKVRPILLFFYYIFFCNRMNRYQFVHVQLPGRIHRPKLLDRHRLLQAFAVPQQRPLLPNRHHRLQLPVQRRLDRPQLRHPARPLRQPALWRRHLLQPAQRQQLQLRLSARLPGQQLPAPDQRLRLQPVRQRRHLLPSGHWQRLHLPVPRRLHGPTLRPEGFIYFLMNIKWTNRLYLTNAFLSLMWLILFRKK